MEDRYTLSEGARRQIAAFDLTSKEELCGLLVGTHINDQWYVVEVIPVTNSSDEPRKTYDIKAGEAKKALKKAGYQPYDLIGSFHTHPKGSGHGPSVSDIVEFPTDMIGLVLHATTKQLCWFDHPTGFLYKEDM